MKYTEGPIYEVESENLIKTHRKDTICNILYANVDWDKPNSKQITISSFLHIMGIYHKTC